MNVGIQGSGFISSKILDPTGKLNIFTVLYLYRYINEFYSTDIYDTVLYMNHTVVQVYRYV